MCVITNTYKKMFLQRYDKDPAIPYYSASDFPGLECEEGSFRNTNSFTSPKGRVDSIVKPSGGTRG